MRKILLMILAGTACLLNSCGQKVSNDFALSRLFSG